MQFLILLFTLSSCSTMDPTFEPYLIKFKEESLKYGRQDLQNVKIDIQFAHLSDKNEQYQVVGVCRYIPLFKAIFIDKDFWEESPEVLKEIVIFHELGHCVLDRDHDEETSFVGMPRTIMYPSVLSSRWYIPKRDYYLKELFTK